MFEFDLQRFDEEVSQSTETQSEEQKPLPEELNGLPEEIARETLNEWEQSQAASEEQPTSAEPAAPQTEESVPYARFKEKVDEANRLKAELEKYRQAPQPQSQPQTQPQPARQIQLPQLKVTPEMAKRINQAIDAEAMALSGMSKDDVASLEYADDDDPRIAQWQQSKSIAQNNVITALRQMHDNQQRQAQQFYANHTAAVNSYNEFAQKEFAEPDFKEIQNFATNEFFEQLSPGEQTILANSYLRVERQLASPAEMLVVKNYYERAKAAYRTRGAKKTPAQHDKKNSAQPTLPRSDQLKGASGTSNKQLSTSDIEKMLAGDFTKIDPEMQKTLLAIT